MPGDHPSTVLRAMLSASVLVAFIPAASCGAPPGPSAASPTSAEPGEVKTAGEDPPEPEGVHPPPAEEGIGGEAPVVEEDREEEPAVSGRWRGEWRDRDGFVFALDMELSAEDERRIEGQIEWTLEASPRLLERRKVGERAIEYVRGSFDRESGSLSLEGYRQDDPRNVIGLDVYRLDLSGDVLSGKTRNHGPWTGRFSAKRVGP